MTQQMFDDLIGHPPPSTIDVDAIVRKQRFRRRLRQAPIALAAVAVLAVGAAATGFGDDAAHKPPERAPVSLSGPKIHLVVDTAEAKAKSAEELTKAYDEAVKKAVPGAEWKGGKPPKVTDEEAAPPAEFMFGATLIVNGKPGGLVIQVGPEAGPDDVPMLALNCDNPDGHCKETEGPNGEKLIVRRWDFRDGQWEKGDVYTAVTVGLENGRALNLESHQDLLTEQQISAIVSDLAARIE